MFADAGGEVSVGYTSMTGATYENLKKNEIYIWALLFME